MNRPKLKTAAEVRAEWSRNGVTATEWALLHNFPTHIVGDVLRGANKGSRGHGHKIAVALGLKEAAPEGAKP